VILVEDYGIKRVTDKVVNRLLDDGISEEVVGLL
jgi:hypothetical protein